MILMVHIVVESAPVTDCVVILAGRFVARAGIGLEDPNGASISGL